MRLPARDVPVNGAANVPGLIGLMPALQHIVAPLTRPFGPLPPLSFRWLLLASAGFFHVATEGVDGTELLRGTHLGVEQGRAGHHCGQCLCPRHRDVQPDPVPDVCPHVWAYVPVSLEIRLVCRHVSSYEPCRDDEPVVRPIRRDAAGRFEREQVDRKRWSPKGVTKHGTLVP